MGGPRGRGAAGGRSAPPRAPNRPPPTSWRSLGSESADSVRRLGGCGSVRLQGPLVYGPLVVLLVIGRPGSVRSSLLAQSADPVASSPPARQYDDTMFQAPIGDTRRGSTVS